MAIKAYTLTLSGSSENLASALAAAGATITPGGEGDGSFASVILQSNQDNAGDIYIGNNGQTVTSASYGTRLEANAEVAPAVREFDAAGGSSLRLSDFVVLGTANEKLHVLGVER